MKSKRNAVVHSHVSVVSPS